MAVKKKAPSKKKAAAATTEAAAVATPETAPAKKAAKPKAPKASAEKAVKPAAKKAAKPAATKAPAEKAAKKPAANKPITEAMTKVDVINAIAEMTNLTQKDVGQVFATMKTLIEQHMMKKGSGEFTIPDAGVKIHRIHKGPSKARNGHNPYTGEAMTIPAKKARNVVRASALKFLKDAVA